jgi:VWFA-related protein
MAVLAVSTLSAAPVQSPEGPLEQRFKTRTYAVRIDALVLHDGRPLVGLGPDDFRVTDNGIPQPVAVVSPESIAIDLIAVHDTSGSVSGGTFSELRSALLKVTEQLRPQDRAALVSFSQDVEVTVALTGDRGLFARETAALRSEGRTRLRDGLFAAMALTSEERRTLVLVLTDGVDTGSWLDGETLLQVCDRTDATVYVVLMGPEEMERPDRAVLTEVARRTGGRAVAARSADAVGNVFQRLLSEFNSRYVLAYSPQPPTRGWHGVQVSLSRSSKKVVARRGYWLE